MLSDMMGIFEKSIVSIVGAGGKTSLMLRLCNELRHKKVLMTTSTKIYMPDKSDYDFKCVGQTVDKTLQFCKSNKSGVYLLAHAENDEGKLIGLRPSEIDCIVGHFDMAIIEADESKGKPLKGWAETEPVVSATTTHTVGVVSLLGIGVTLCEQNVHRAHVFSHISGCDVGQGITANHIKNMIVHKDGFFCKSIGKKVLLINAADTPQKVEDAHNMLELFSSEQLAVFDKIVIATLRGEGAATIVG